MILPGIDFFRLGLFCSRKSTKRKKGLQRLPPQMTERLARPEAETSQVELATPEAKTTDLGSVNS